jgi:hypothetical protein
MKDNTMYNVQQHNIWTEEQAYAAIFWSSSQLFLTYLAKSVIKYGRIRSCGLLHLSGFEASHGE